MIFVNCPSCTALLKLQDTAAGKRVPCPKCKAVVSIPKTQPTVPPPEATAVPPSSQTQPARPQAIQPARPQAIQPARPQAIQPARPQAIQPARPQAQAQGQPQSRQQSPGVRRTSNHAGTRPTVAPTSYIDPFDLNTIVLEDLEPPQPFIGIVPGLVPGSSPQSPGQAPVGSPQGTQSSKWDPSKSTAPKAVSSKAGTSQLTLIIASVVAGGSAALGLLTLILLWLMFQGPAQENTLAANTPPENGDAPATTTPQPTPTEVAQPKTTPNGSSSVAASPPTANPSDSTTTAATPPNFDQYATVLTGEFTVRPEPATPPAWTKYYNEARAAGDKTYAFRQTVNGVSQWMLGRWKAESQGRLTSVTSAGGNIVLLKYFADPKLPLAHPVKQLNYPELLVKEFQSPDFEIKRLVSFGIRTDRTPAPREIKIRPFAWSNDGKHLFIIETDPQPDSAPRQRRLVKVNTSTWKVEGTAQYAADDIAVCSEGIVLSLRNNYRTGTELGDYISLIEKGPIFPLQSSQETDRFLALIDPQTLALKYYFAMPQIRHITALPNSSRVFVSQTESFLFEMDVKTGELIRLVQDKYKFRNLELSPQDGAMYSHWGENRVSQFDTTDEKISQIGVITGIGTWNSLSSLGKFLVVPNNSKYLVHDAKNLDKPVAELTGPKGGMACIDDKTKSLLIAGVDLNGNLTARIVKDDLDQTLILGQSKFSEIKDASGSIVKSRVGVYTQASEKFRGEGSAPLDWMRFRTPFYITASPNGNGFLLFTFDGAFLIRPTKPGKEYSFELGNTKIVDLSVELEDDSADKLRKGPPQSLPQSFELSRAESVNGQLFALPKGLSINKSEAHPVSGDIYLVAYNQGGTISAPQGHCVMRIKSDDLKGDKPVPVAAAKIFVKTTNDNPELRCINFGGQDCLAFIDEQVLWLLDLESLEPVKFDSLPNPIDLSKEPYRTAFKNTENYIYRFEIEPSRGSAANRLNLICWHNTNQWNSAAQIDSMTGKIVRTLTEEEAGVKVQGRTQPWRWFRDPFGKLAIQSTQVFINGTIENTEYNFQLVLRSKPWLLARTKEEVLFLNRTDLKDAHSLPIPAAIERNRGAPFLSTEDTKGDRIIMSAAPVLNGNEYRTGSMLWLLPISEANLPETPLLATDLALPKMWSPGKELIVPFSVSDPQANVSATHAPDGVVVENGVFKWTPTLADSGFQTIQIELSVGSDRAVEVFEIAVSTPPLQLSLEPQKVAISEDGKYIVAVSGLDLAIIDTEKMEVVSHQKIQTSVQHLMVKSGRIIASQGFDNFVEIPLNDPSKRTKHVIPESSKLSYARIDLHNDKHLVFINDYSRNEFVKNSLVAAKTLSPVKDSPLAKYISKNVASYANFKDTNETLFGSVILDENDKVQYVLSLDWSRLMIANSSQYHLGYSKNAILLNDYLYGTGSSLNLGPGVFVSFEEKRTPDFQFARIDAILSHGLDEKVSLGTFVSAPLNGHARQVLFKAGRLF